MPGLDLGAELGELSSVEKFGIELQRGQVAEAGLASGLINTTQQIGGALGLAVLVAIATSRTESALESGAAAPAAVTSGFQVALAAGAGITVLALVAAAVALPRARRQPATVPGPA